MTERRGRRKRKYTKEDLGTCEVCANPFTTNRNHTVLNCSTCKTSEPRHKTQPLEHIMGHHRDGLRWLRKRLR